MYFREITPFSCSGYLNFLFATFNFVIYLHSKLIMSDYVVENSNLL